MLGIKKKIELNTREIIESGLLELYCIGATTPEETALIGELLEKDAELKAEFDAIQLSIEKLSVKNVTQPSGNLLRAIFDSIANADAEKLQLPPLLSATTNADDWLHYLEQHNIHKPENDQPVNMIEFANTPALVTYVAWAVKGACIEESHENEIERLFMLQGSCKIVMNGESFNYTVGDFVEIPPGTTHFAEATSDGIMILIGQRVAA